MNDSSKSIAYTIENKFKEHERNHVDLSGQLDMADNFVGNVR